MKSQISVFSRLGLALVMAAILKAGAASAQDNGPTVRVPVVMEEATVRGKVAVLESTREERRVIGGLKVNVWSTKESEETTGSRWGKKSGQKRFERDVLLKETATDDLGLFALPKLEVGEYLLDVSDIEFRLTVIPQSSERAGQTEPKVMLILIPKEVVTINPEQTQEQDVTQEVSAPSSDTVEAAGKAASDSSKPAAAAESAPAQP